MVADRLDDVFGPASEFEDFGQGAGQRQPLPENTRVLAELVAATGREYSKGRYTVDTEYKVTAVPAGLGRAGFHLWDRFKLSYPATAADMKGQDDDTVKRWKASVSMWTRRVAAFGFSREAAWPVGGPDAAKLTETWAPRIGTAVIIRVGIDPAGRAYTDKDGNQQVTRTSKNTVQDYEPASPELLSKHGLSTATDSEATPF